MATKALAISDISEIIHCCQDVVVCRRCLGKGSETLPLPAFDPTICRMSRAALRWSRARLAREANLSTETIRVYELGGVTGSLHANHISAVMAALRAAGLEFVVDPETGRTSIHFAQIQHHSQLMATTPDNC
jgi:hypothetical protein